MMTAETFWANIYIGLRAGYSGKLHHMAKLEKLCQNYVDKVGLAVTVTKTKFIYTKGNEPGAIIGLINYPRFPQPPLLIAAHATALAEILKDKLGQERVSIVTPHVTTMLGEK